MKDLKINFYESIKELSKRVGECEKICDDDWVDFFAIFQVCPEHLDAILLARDCIKEYAFIWEDNYIEVLKDKIKQVLKDNKNAIKDEELLQEKAKEKEDRAKYEELKKRFEK